MRRKDREITDPEAIAAILDEAKILHLGLFDEDFPYVVPLHYGCTFENGELILYVHSAKEGHKLDLIRRDPRVCVEIDCGMVPVSGGDEPCRYGALFSSVIGRGRAEIVDEDEEKIKGLALLMKHQTGRDFAFTPAMAAGVAVIRIRIAQLTAKARKG